MALGGESETNTIQRFDCFFGEKEVEHFRKSRLGLGGVFAIVSFALVTPLGSGEL